jgi:EAL and modified HD-GYP domain-containing signal transduction protein
MTGGMSLEAAADPARDPARAGARTAGDPAAIAIARQAIHDRWTRVVGYAVLLRGAPADDEQAATRAIVDTFTALGVAAIAGEQPAHVRVPRRFLLEMHALALPAERVVLEVAGADPDDSALRDVLDRLATQRYRISLLAGPRAPVPRELARLADSVKVDVTGLTHEQIEEAVVHHAPAGATLIAAGVDTHALLAQCRAAGFERFQGFFLCTPDVVEGQAPPTARVADLRALAGLYGRATFEELEQTISRDVGLSYRLLTYLNSAYFNLARRVASVREAIVLLGVQAVRRWATLIALAGTEDTPHELTVTALVRGRMCELIGRDAPDSDPEACFTVGLFSVVDAIARAPLAQVLDQLPLTDDVRRALTEHAGPMGAALAAVLAYERGDLLDAARLAPGATLGDLYLDALGWADATSGVLRSTTATSADTTSGAN